MSQLTTLVKAGAKLFAASWAHPNKDKNVVIYDHSVKVVPTDSAVTYPEHEATAQSN
jgi:hypothetical protein